jgi:hypothetical protein
MSSAARRRLGDAQNVRLGAGLAHAAPQPICSQSAFGRRGQTKCISSCRWGGYAGAGRRIAGSSAR